MLGTHRNGLVSGLLDPSHIIARLDQRNPRERRIWPVLEDFGGMAVLFCGFLGRGSVTGAGKPPEPEPEAAEKESGGATTPAGAGAHTREGEGHHPFGTPARLWLL